MSAQDSQVPTENNTGHPGTRNPGYTYRTPRYTEPRYLLKIIQDTPVHGTPGIPTGHPGTRNSGYTYRTPLYTEPRYLLKIIQLTPLHGTHAGTPVPTENITFLCTIFRINVIVFI